MKVNEVENVECAILEMKIMVYAVLLPFSVSDPLTLFTLRMN